MVANFLLVVCAWSPYNEVTPPALPIKTRFFKAQEQHHVTRALDDEVVSRVNEVM